MDTSYDGGVKEFGAIGDGEFNFDNEFNDIKEIILPFEIKSSPVTNGDYLEFLSTDAYQRSELWLSDGWDWVNKESIRSPFTGFMDGETWKENFFAKVRNVDLKAPVSHISF